MLQVVDVRLLAHINSTHCSRLQAYNYLLKFGDKSDSNIVYQVSSHSWKRCSQTTFCAGQLARSSQRARRLLARTR